MIIKKAFVSGAAGVIGKELIKILLKNSYEILAGDLLPCPKEFDGKILYRQGDLNFIKPEELIEFKPDVFFHLAATFERSVEQYSFWSDNYWNNVQLTHHLTTLIKDLPSIKKIIFASSYLIYNPNLYQFENPKNKPIFLKESDEIYPRNLIGAAKLNHEIDMRFLNIYKSENYDTICARIFRGYGCNSRDVISRWIRDLLQGKKIKVYKEEGIFDYIYATDSAMGLFKLSQTNNFKGIINLGTGKPRKVKEIINILEKYFPLMEVDKEEIDIPFEASGANIELLKKKVGWIPEYNLESAIPEIINFERRKLCNEKEESQSKITVLISSAGKKPLWISTMKKALSKFNKNHSIIVGDSSRDNFLNYEADDFLLMKPTYEEDKYELANELKSRGVNIVLPSRDGELVFWSTNYKFFKERGIEVIISPLESIITCLDKLKFSKFCTENEFNTISTQEDIEKINHERYVVKERFGSGAISIGLNLTKEEAKKHSKKLKNPIFQKFISGKEISIDAWLDKRYKVKGLVLRTRDKIINGESQITTTFRDQNIESKAIKLLEKLKLRGPILLQAFITFNNELKFLECNSRFGGGSTLSVEVGLDSFYWSILEFKNENLKNYKFFRKNNEIKQIRVPKNIFKIVNDYNI